MSSIIPIFILTFIIQSLIFIYPAEATDDDLIPSAPIITRDTWEKHDYHNKQVIIKYKDATTKELQSITKKSSDTKDIEKDLATKKEKILSSLKRSSQIDDLKIQDHIDDIGIDLITSEKENTEELIKKLSQNTNVEYAEPNYVKIPTFTPTENSSPRYFSTQWAHYNTGQTINFADGSSYTGTNDADIDSTEMWDIERSDASQIIVAVIDSGIDYSATDISTNMWNGSTSCKSDTGTIISCPYHGWDYQNNDNDPSDDTGHGTHVASIIGATTNNAIGIAGMSRYNHLKLMAVRFDLDTFSEIQAINFAKNNGAKVINASFAGYDYSQLEKNAIDSFPGIVVTAAGNDANNNDAQNTYPCNYSSTNIICVGASGSNDTLAPFSNYGESIDIAAPGQNILGIQQGDYWYGSGTSFAASFITGTAALMYAHNPSASIGTIRSTLLQSSDHPASLTDKIACNRRLNINNAIRAAKSNTIPTESCPTPVYRFWSDKNQGHFYTINEEEKNAVINNYDDYVWKYEGSAFYASNSSGVPIYRFWSDKNQHHFYTASAQERDQVINNYDDFVWRYEGIAYYAATNGTPIYRFWSDKNQSHFYTASTQERDQVINNYDDFVWRYEGIAYYAY